MAFLLNNDTQAYIPLAPHHTFGRLGNRVNTVLDKPYISKLHTTIEWRNARWSIKNLGRNGTLVNGTPLLPGEMRALKKGDHIHFAEPNDPAFEVIDLSAPCDILWPLNNQTIPRPINLDRYHLLPDENAPSLTVFQDNQQWFVEPLQHQADDMARPLQAGEIIQVEDTQWQFIPADIYDPTEAKARSHDALPNFEFVFELSQDEESTQLTLKAASQKIDLGVRTHHYLLLQLARHRAHDQASGLSDIELGWVYTEELIKELGLDETHANIQIFRARKQLSEALPHLNIQRDLIHRRGGKLRFGCDKFTIYKSGQLHLQSPRGHEAQPQNKTVLSL